MFGLEKLGSVHCNARIRCVLLILIKESIHGAKLPPCQIVRFYPWCKIVGFYPWYRIARGDKLSVFTHSVKFSAVKFSWSPIVRCQIVRCQIVWNQIVRGVKLFGVKLSSFP